MDMAGSNEAGVPQGVLLENLNIHNPPWKLARHIFRMLTAVGVISNDIQRIAVDSGQGTALVQLRTKDVVHFVVYIFRDVRCVMNFYDIRKLSKDPLRLKVSDWTNRPRTTRQPGDKSMKSPAEKGPSPEEETVPCCEKGTSQAPQDVTEGAQIEEPCTREQPTETSEGESSSSYSSTSGIDFKILSEEVCRPQTLEASTSTSGIPARQSSGLSAEEEPKQVMIDVKTSTPQVSPCFCPETVFYHRLQHVGHESRHAEFKRGGVVFDLRAFRTVVGRYMCAFLNTEGGTIYFGVSDDGKALGIKIDQKTEDQVRLVIDTAVSMIKPDVPPHAYSINFAKIMNDQGQIEGSLKVLEVCVKPREPPDHKFSFDNATLVRRDGSLRAL